MQRQQQSVLKRLVALATTCTITIALVGLPARTAEAAQTGVEDPSPVPYILAGVGGLVVAGLLIWVAWPSSPKTETHASASDLPLIPEVSAAKAAETTLPTVPASTAVVAPWLGSSSGGLAFAVTW